jgi:hypothetical protein
VIVWLLDADIWHKQRLFEALLGIDDFRESLLLGCWAQTAALRQGKRE